jgi:succinate dehydrogenase (ubiquinone) cytochrome b560 subunit
LSIYQPQITWYLSAFHRVTGFAVTGVFYLGAMAYAVLPMDSAVLMQSVHALPGVVLFLGKSLLAAPFFFHTFNGIRHLVLYVN